MKYSLTVFSFFIIILSVFAIANVNYLHNSVVSNYTAGDKITGKFNIDIANQNADSEITSNFPGNTTLISFLKSHPGLSEGNNYQCSTTGCYNDYASTGSISQMQLGSENKFAGFGLDGPGVTVNSAKITINSNAPSSCSPNLYVDFLADDLDIITSDKSSGQSCGIKHVGCYDILNVAETTIVTGKEYCEKISIPAAPAFMLGGKIRMGGGNSNLTMRLYDFDTTNLLGSCRLPQNTESVQELNCIVNYSSSEVKNYYVCVSTGLNNNYKIGAETNSPTCGTAQGFNSLNSDIDVFAETMTYAANPIFTINQTTYTQRTGVNLQQMIENYIQDKYSSDCQEDTCFVPMKISGVSQTVSFTDFGINYESVGLVKTTGQIYGLNDEPAKITADNISLDVGYANFVIPVESTANKFKIYIDGDQIFEKSISVKKSFTFEVFPLVVPFALNTKFTASSNVNITRTVWNFGDGTPVQNISGNSIFHSFTKLNSSFDIEVTAVSNQTQATRKFKVFIGNPKDVANSTIIEYKKRLANITNKTNSYPSWSVEKIKAIVEISLMTSELNSIEKFYNNATTETDYQNVMLDLIELDVPYSIYNSDSGNDLPLSIGYENINVNYIEQIENKDISDNEKLKLQIVGWMDSNFNPKISFTKIAKISDSGTESVATLFKITTESSGYSGKAYLILGNDIINSGAYKSNYNHVALTSGVDYIVLDNSIPQIFEFVMEGDFDAQTLGAYISPSMAVLESMGPPEGECNLNNICDSSETSETCPEDCSRKWFKFTIFGWIILFFAAFVVYIIMQEWYKHNYQKSLFSDANELYNLINFIYNTRKSGLSDSEAKSKLKQQGWTGEQVNFAFKKIDGKRIGMLEIPIFKWRENKQVVKQISRMQPQGRLDARFIKRPY